MADFVTQFHNLDGDLLSDRKKSFFKLLKATSLKYTQSDIDNALQNLHPNSYQERLFLVEALVYFKKIEPLINLLKEGNREFVKIILRQTSFIQEAFKNTTPTQLVNELFPCLSHSIKLKLLRKLSSCWSEERLDELFDAVRSRYGLFTASGVLHACTTPKVEHLLRENEILLNTCQVIHILDKSEDLFKIYVDNINNLSKKLYSEKNVINLLALKNPVLFLQLLNSNKIEPSKLTKAASTNLIKNIKEDILKDPERFVSILNARSIVTKFGSDFKEFYRNIYPKKIKNLDSNSPAYQLLKYFPKNRRWNLFIELYHIQFPNKTLEELLGTLDETIITLKPASDVVKLWAEVNYKATDDEKFLQYYSPSVSIPILKEKINVTSEMTRRQTLLHLLITTCGQNKDMESLDKVLEYIFVRHKNEDGYTYKRILELVCKTFSETELTKSHWNFIRQGIVLLRTGGRVIFYDYKNVNYKLLEYAYKYDKELFNTVAYEYMRDACEGNLTMRELETNKDLEREIFREFCKKFPGNLSTDHQYFHSMECTLISDFCDICQESPKNALNLLEYPYLMSIMETLCNIEEVAEVDYFDQRVIRSAIVYHLTFPQHSLPFLNESKIIDLLTKFCEVLNNDVVATVILAISRKNTISKIEENILIAFFGKMNLENVGEWNMENVIRDNILYRPKLLMSHFEKLGSKIALFYNKIIGHYSHIGLDKKLSDYLVENWPQDDNRYQEKAISALQELLPSEEFIQFVEKNICSETPEDPEKEQLQIDARLHTVDLLKKTNEPSKFLALAIQFLKFDVKRALPSLYSLFYRSPENLLYPHLETLSKDTQFEKHTIFLSSELLDYNHFLRSINITDPSSSSLCKYLCLSTLKYFIKNKSAYLFVLVKNYLNLVKQDDYYTISRLVKVTVPKEYRAEYVEICWKICERINNKKIKINEYFDKLLKQLFDVDILKSVSSSFIHDILVGYLPLQAKDGLTNINHFTILCLVYKTSENDDYFKTTFETLSKLDKNMINDFCTKFVNFAYDKKLDSEFLNKFIQNWNKYFSVTDALDQYITFNLLHQYLSNPTEEYGKNIVDYLEQLSIELGPQVFEMYKDKLEALITTIKNLNRYRLFHVMLNYKSSSTTCVLVIKLLTPVDSEDNDESIGAYNNITGFLDSVSIPIVKSYYEIYLRNHA